MFIWEQSGRWYCFGFAPKMVCDCDTFELSMIMWIQLVGVTVLPSKE